MIKFNPNSPAHLSVLLFGGVLKETQVVPILDEDGNPVLMKTGHSKGQIKTRKEEVLVRIEGLNLNPRTDWKTSKEGIWSTKEEVLQLISKGEGDAKEIAKTMLRIRELEKQLQTYYTSFQDLIYKEDSCVHASFTHVGTDTSRLACSKPNLQNIPTGYSNIKEHFTSRFKDGLILAADYSQLEIRIQAQLCKDPNYIQDIIDGVDFHSKRVAMKEGRDYGEVLEEVNAGNERTIQARSLAKGFSFARAYGAGKKKISQQTGLTEEEVEVLIENEDRAYPNLKLFNEWNMQLIEKQGWYKDPWGRRYAFRKYPAPFWLQKLKGVKEAYSPTEAKNYIIQGFATGNVVLVMLGKFWREKAIHNRHIPCESCQERGRVYNWSEEAGGNYETCGNCNGKGFFHKYLLINTVHDSVMLDVRKDYLEDAKKDLQILEDCGKLSESEFNYKFIVPIKIDLKYGKSWLEC
jgi:DNA polymerase I-like protein with 3'-5' exonuclease and polymerase domains